MYHKVGIVAGSFDPITIGHVWLINAAANMIGPEGKLHVVIGVNSSKKGYFAPDERAEQVKYVLAKNIKETVNENIVVESINNQLLINHAESIGASYIFRGIRNPEDFYYESQIQQVNRKINPNVETVFFIPPYSMTEVSSSTVKSLVGFHGWEDIVSKYVDNSIVNAFKSKINGNRFQNT